MPNLNVGKVRWSEHDSLEFFLNNASIQQSHTSSISWS